MSLLNDMLRDLAQRSQPRYSEGLADNPTLDHALSHTDKEQMQYGSLQSEVSKKPWVSLVTLFVCVFFCVACAQLIYHNLHKKHYLLPDVSAASQHLEATFAQVENTATASGLQNSLENKKPNGAEVVVAPSTIEIQSTSNPATENEIDFLLQQAQRAIAMERLTSPIEDNAFAYYQKILQLNPSHADAMAGIEAIALRYLEKSRAHCQGGNHQQCNELVARARYVSAETVDRFAANISEPTLPAPTTFDDVQLGAQSPIADTSESILPDQASIVAQQLPTRINAQAPSLHIEPDAPGRDKQMAETATELIKAGQGDKAEIALVDFIAAEKNPQAAAKILATYYIQQQRVEKFKQLLLNATFFSAADRHLLEARLLFAQQQPQAAVELLESHRADAQHQEEYLATLASGYHSLARYAQSLSAYQQLIREFGDAPAYWLGLALAFDGLQQTKNALQAYQHLQRLPQVQGSVKDYIDQRILTLRAE